MTLEKVDIKPDVYPKLVFMQLLSDKYFDNVLNSYGLTKRKEEFAGHEFHIQYFSDFIKCSIWTDCDNYSIQYIDLYRIDNAQKVRIDFRHLTESIAIQNLYSESSKESVSLTKTFVEKYLNKKGEYEELNRPLKEYYERKGAKLFEQNFYLHSELFSKHPELFRIDFEFRQDKVIIENERVAIKKNYTKNL